MKRADWLDRLWETIEAHRLLPFRWGATGDAHDCCSFAAACIDAMTDGDHVAQLLANYTDEESARAYIERCGGLAATVSTHLGGPKAIGFMGRGDIAIVSRGGREYLGVCVGDDVVAAGELGLLRSSREFVTACWGI